jgi:WD40 repeat protein
MEQSESLKEGALPVAGVPFRLLKGHKKGINCLDASASDKGLVASGSDDKTVRLWDIRTERASKCICFDEAVEAVRFGSIDHETLYAASGKHLFAFDLRTGGLITKSTSCIETATAEDDISSISVDSEYSSIAVSDDNGVVTIMEVGPTRSLSKRPKQLRGVHTSIVASIAFHPVNVKSLISGGFDCLVCAWDLTTGRSTAAVNVSQMTGSRDAQQAGSQLVNPAFVQSVSYVLDGAGIAATCGDGTVGYDV